MRWSLPMGCLLAACAAAASAADFPYVAYVNSADVYIRSGPGRDYYPTDKLQKGEKVEVYRHDPGGWYAIRPPIESFSWVSKRHLDPRGDGLATVNTARTVARVGSALSDVREVIQVRLDKGELLELLETAAVDSPWCKVRPPTGEFRWIFSKYVERELPADLAADEREASHRQGATSTASVADSQAANQAGVQNGSYQALALDQEVNRIELDLSAMVAQDTSAWSFGELERRTQVVLSQSQSTVERGQARVLLNKLARFEDIRRRQEAIRRGPDELAREGSLPPLDTRRADTSRFDGVGRLSPVISDKTGGPQYALVDQSNAVISFVTPAPGVNLRPYVDRYVGVNGQRGYLADLQRQHISVQRISLLDVERR